MSIVGLALYGSRAREDHDEDSDVDLLAVTSAGTPRATAAHDHIAIASYPCDEVIGSARRGDLFALHIVTEAKVLYEAWPVFEEMQRAFTYRPDYRREVKVASDVGWFLLRYRSRFPDGRLLTEKMAWCTRTILIARAAGARRPVFSADGLARFSGSPHVAALIRNKGSEDVDGQLLEAFRKVLTTFGAAVPPMPTTLGEQWRTFQADRNGPGMAAVRGLKKQCPAGSIAPESGESA